MLQFDRHAAAYDAIRAKIVYPASLYERLARSCSRHRAALDIGCGAGASTAHLVPYFSHVEGVDIGANLIDRARVSLPNLSFTVSSAESFVPGRRFDLVTCATAFYWMDRDVVFERCAGWLDDGGVFCAYRYDFPVVYGPARDVVERALVEHWAAHRDPRLVAYDDTLERLSRCATFEGAHRFVEPNVLTLDTNQLCLFFLSTSYVTRFLERHVDPEGWSLGFRDALHRATRGEPVSVNFDIHGYAARRVPRG